MCCLLESRQIVYIRRCFSPGGSHSSYCVDHPQYFVLLRINPFLVCCRCCRRNTVFHRFAIIFNFNAMVSHPLDFSLLESKTERGIPHFVSRFDFIHANVAERDTFTRHTYVIGTKNCASIFLSFFDRKPDGRGRKNMY